MAVLRLANEPSLEIRLGQLSHNALKKMAAALDLRAASTKPESLAHALAERLGAPAHRARLYQKLNSDDWAYLARLALHPFPLRLHALVLPLRRSGLDADCALAKITHLAALGCIVPYQLHLPYPSAIQHLGIEAGALRSMGAYATFTLAPGVAQWAVERAGAPFTLAPTTPPARVVEPRPTELMRAAFLVLAEAERKPVKLTAKGTIYKAELNRLAAALANVPTSAPKGGKRRAAVGEPPALLWFAVAALQGAGLLVAGPQGLGSAPDASGFLAAPPGEQTRRLLEGWLSGRFDEFPRVGTLTGQNGTWYAEWTRPEPWFPSDGWVWGPTAEHVLAARALVLDVLKRAVARHPDEWYRIDELAKLVYEQDNELLFERYDDYTLLMAPGTLGSSRGARERYEGIFRAGAKGEAATLSPERDWPEVEGAFVRQVVGESLRWLGLVEVGPDEDGPERFRLTPMARHQLYGSALPPSEALANGGPPARIQPSFEVVVLDVFTNAALAARLDTFAERRSFDRAATYRLTQDALLRGLDRGLTGEEILAFLASVGGGPLPQNVDYTLREWIRRYESLTVHEGATLLEADSAAQLDSWLADAQIAPCLGKRTGPTSVLVPVRHAARLGEALRRRKIHPREIDYTHPPRHVFQFAEPDRIAVAADHLEPFLAYRLACFGEEVGRVREAGTERVVYRITPNSVRGATAGGWNAADIASFLLEGADQGLPVEISSRLHGWGGAVPPARYESLVAIHLPNEPVGWDDLTAIPAIGALLRLVPTPYVALVAPADLDALRSELAARGLRLEAGALSAEELAAGSDEVLSEPIAESLLRALGGHIGLADLSDLRAVPRRGVGPR